METNAYISDKFINLVPKLDECKRTDRWMDG